MEGYGLHIGQSFRKAAEHKVGCGIIYVDTEKFAAVLPTTMYAVIRCLDLDGKLENFKRFVPCSRCHYTYTRWMTFVLRRSQNVTSQHMHVESCQALAAILLWQHRNFVGKNLFHVISIV
jgi:hypothetical protein